MSLNGFFILAHFFFILMGAVPSLAQQQQTTIVQNEEEKNDLFYICKNNKSTRWLRAYRLDSGKCHTQYSKEGYLQIVSSATYWSSCEGVLHNIRKNIEEGGFKCIKTEAYSYLEVE